MDTLKLAVVDVTTLIATCHALKAEPAHDDGDPSARQRRRLRRELKRATLAYVDAMGRAGARGFDARAMQDCRVRAEREMPEALALATLLDGMLAHAPGALDGVAAIRHDLWRLVNASHYLSIGSVELLAAGGSASRVSLLSQRLGRRLRKAVAGYARSALRAKLPPTRRVAKARDAALARLGGPAMAAAERLAALEAAGASPGRSTLRVGVLKALSDLAADWRAPVESTQPSAGPPAGTASEAGPGSAVPADVAAQRR